jgi:hypothetical protein
MRQVSPIPQASPQSPQLVAVVVSTSQPFPGIRSQSAQPASHVNPQVPPMHVRVAFGRFGQFVQLLPHAAGLASFDVQLFVIDGLTQ